MGTYIHYSFDTLWQAGIGDRLVFAILGRPEHYRVSWGDGTARRYARDNDLNGDGIGDAALAGHRYATDGVYTIAVRPDPADDLPPRRLRAHVHAHAEQGATASGGDRDEMFLMSDHADTVRTGNGFNWVSAGAGDDRVVGGAGTDVIDGGVGEDVLNGGAGQDQLYGGAGDDVLRGGDGPDYLDGGDGNDRLYGEESVAFMLGGDGDDALVGGALGDTLEGGDGADRLTGGASGDTFVFRPGERGRDVITDFGNEGRYAPDYISLSAFGPGLSFIGTDRFSGTAGEVRYAQNDRTTVVFADMDGDRVAYFTITLLGSVALTRDDFLL